MPSRLLAPGCWLLLAACATPIGTRIDALPPDPASEGFRILSKPVTLPRGSVTFDCGPEALAAILMFYGKPADVDRITALIYDPKANGTIATKIPRLARELGLASTAVTGSVSRLRGSVGRDHPCLIMVRVRESIHHFFVVSGINDAKALVVCEDYDGRKRLLAWPELETMWKPVGFWCMELFPAGASEDVASAQDLEANGRYADALARYRRALQQDPDDPDAHAGAANCLKLTGDAKGARAEYEEALKRKADHAVALINYADLIAVDEPARAAELAGRAVDACRIRTDEVKAELAKASRAERLELEAQMADEVDRLTAAFGTLGQAEAAAGHPVPAISAFKASLDLMALTEFDRRASRLVEIGEQYAKLGQEKEARLHYGRALETAKDEKLRGRIEARLR